MTKDDLTAARWRKSSYSGGQGGDCVEVAALAGVVGIRDSKDPHGPKLVMETTAWQALAAQLKS
ncbi:DUF397 domain-containing protein [Actinomadura macrotermitis]|uniref:DUF397 domain-containing protein n=1 Tax=Actinomadura macrotermitis TaxID=2585200 RepID=UPI002E272C43